MAHDVFISYAHHDKTVADAVCAGLEAAGIRCWIAPRDIIAGTPWPRAIPPAVKQSRVMVLIFSSSANQSDYVLREVTLAATAKIPILAFRIEDVVAVDELAFFLCTHHWLDALTAPLTAHIHKLRDDITHLLPTAPTPPPFSPPAPADTGKRSAQPPTIKLLSLVEGQEVSGARVSDGKNTWKTPIILKLESGGNYHFSSTFTDAAGKAYANAMEVTATWTGEQTCRVALVQVPSASAATGISAQLGIEWVTIPAGDFLYGEDNARKKLPTYQLMKYPVTVAQYRHFCTATGRQMPDAPYWGWQDTHPVVNVNWDDAAAFATWAGLALPTEEEWE